MTKMLPTLCTTMAAAVAILATGCRADPETPDLTFLYSMNCTLGSPIDVGAGPRGTRNVLPILGGTFSGPRVSGRILNLGADWSLTDSRGTFNADTHYQLQTDDGANIYIRTSGPGQSNGKIYLHGVFETGSDKYWWMNNLVAFGVLELGNGWVGIDMFHMV